MKGSNQRKSSASKAFQEVSLSECPKGKLISQEIMNGSLKQTMDLFLRSRETSVDRENTKGNIACKGMLLYSTRLTNDLVWAGNG